MVGRSRQVVSFGVTLAAVFTLGVSGVSGRPAIEQSVAEPAVAAQAQSYKEQGDEYVSEERLTEAAEAYARALALDRAAFTTSERVEMAVYISWEDRLDEAIRELQLVLDEEPDNVGARAHLARVYAWSGRLDDAVSEANRALDEAPGNRDALLVKADALEWQGYFRQAVPLYEELLDSGEGFEARIGLSQALLSAGDRNAALDNARLASPENSRQQTQLEEFNQSIRTEVRPRLDLGYSYYQDSDANQANRYSLLYGFGLGNDDFELGLSRTDSRSAGVDSRSQGASFAATLNPTDGLSVGAAIGVSRNGIASKEDHLTGGLSFDARVSNGSLGVSVARDVLVDTVELIANQIRVTSYGVRAAKPVSDRWSLSGGYGFRDFSDGNRADDFEVTPELLAASRPRVSVGSQVRYQNYRSQTQSGYFDPHDYVAVRGFGSLYYETSALYAYLYGFGGWQRYTRNGASTSDNVIGGSASIGFTPAVWMTLEMNAEGSNFRAGTVSGFNYFTLGSRLTLLF